MTTVLSKAGMMITPFQLQTSYDYEKVVFDSADSHANYFDGELNGEKVEIKLITEDNDNSLWDRVLGSEDWVFVEYRI